MNESCYVFIQNGKVVHELTVAHDGFGVMSNGESVVDYAMDYWRLGEFFEADMALKIKRRDS